MTTESVGTARSRKIGFAAIVGLWITAAICVPFSKILFGRFNFSPEQMLFVRSGVSLVVALFLSGGFCLFATRRVIVAGFLLGASSIGFYRSIAVWDVNPVMVIMTFIPVGNMLIALAEGRKVEKTVIFNLLLIAAGTAFALEPWNRPINVQGFLWAASCVVLCAFGFDQWGKSPEISTVSEKCCWLSLGNMAFAYITMKILRLDFEVAKMFEPQILPTLSIFTVSVTIYIFCSIVPFSRVGKMNTVTASILLQVATPVVIIGAYKFVGEEMYPRQWAGVSAALVGATFLSIQTIRAKSIVLAPAARPG